MSTVSPIPLKDSGQGHAEDEDNKMRRMSERQEKRPEPFILRSVNDARSKKGGCWSGEGLVYFAITAAVRRIKQEGVKREDALMAM